MKSVSFILMFCCIFFNSYSQFSNYSFGDVTKEELQMKECLIEPAAPAMLLGEKCEIVLDFQAPFHSVKITRRIKVLTNEGLSYGNFEHEFLSRLSEIAFFRASVFNLEGDKIVEEKVKSNDAIINQIDKYNSKYIVVLPNVKVGSVIDIYYWQKNNNMIPIQPWYFQSEIPCGWSEYNTRIQKKASYSFYFTDYLPFAINSIKTRLSDPEKKSGYIINKFAVENAPSVHLNEKFVLRPQDQISKVEPVYSSYNQNSIWGNSQGPLTWSVINENLLNSKNLGKVLNKGRFLRSPLEKLLANSTTFDDSLRMVYEFIRQSLKCNGYRSIYSGNIQKVFEEKSGNTGDINLLLIAALREAGFDSHPLLIATNEDPPPSKEDPRRNGVNFLVAAVFRDTSYYLLDASQRELPFNSLSLRCLNGEGFLVTEHLHRQWLPLLRNESFKTKTIVSYAWNPDETDTVFVEKSSYSLSANQLRNMLMETSEEEYVKYRKQYYKNYDISTPRYSGLKETNEPFVENFSFTPNLVESIPGKSYFLPSFPIDAYKENPFNGATRDFRIDFQAPNLQNHEVTIKIPIGYSVVSLPESVSLRSLGNDLNFSFSASVTAERREVIIHSEILIRRESFAKEEYNDIRQFFAEIVKTQKTLIELKRD